MDKNLKVTNKRDLFLIAGAIAVSPVAILMAFSQVMATSARSMDEQPDVGEEAVAVARSFIQSKLQGLAIQISDEPELHTDMVVTLDKAIGFYRVEVSIFDTDGVSHNGYVEVEGGQVKTAMLDGRHLN